MAKVSDALLKQWNNQEINMAFNNGNIAEPQIRANVRYIPKTGLFKVEVVGKKVIETEDITDLCNGLDELFALTPEAFEKRMKDAPQFS